MKTAILLSGGIDSTALTYLRRKELSLAITINYGQKSAEAETRVSKIICKELKIQHELIEIDCSSLGCGEMSLNAKKIHTAPTSEWWPYRNQLIITFASMRAIWYQIDTLLLGTVKTDNKHLDGTPHFYDAMSKTLTIQEGHIQVQAPAINLTSVELVKKAKIPSRLLLWAHSCHTGNIPCGYCNGCIKYTEVIDELKIK